MTVDDAKQAIMERLCPEWRRRGEKASWDRETLQRDLNIPATIFSRAVLALVLDGFLVYLSDRPTSLRLDHVGIAHCEKQRYSADNP